MALAVASLTALGFALRVAGIDQGLYGDELSTYAAVTLASGPGDVVHQITADQDLIATGRYVVELTPPLSFLIAWLTAQVGDPTETVRLGSVIAGTATIPLVYLLGARTVGRRAGLAGAALAALSPFLIFYSVEARGYTLAMLCVLAATLCLVRALESGAARWWVGYAVASCAALYTHYTVVFALFAVAAWALCAYRDRWRPLLGSNVAAAIGYVPWLPEFLDDRASDWNQLPILHPFSLENVGHDLLEWTAQNPLVGFGEVPGTLGGGLIAAGLVVAGAALVAGGAPGGGGDRQGSVSHGPALVIALAVSVPVGLIAWSAIGTTILDSRNMLPSWPGLALAAGALLTAPRRPFAAIATCLVVAGLCVALVRNTDSMAQRPDYRDAAAFVGDATGPADPVIDQPILGLDSGPLSGHLSIYLPDREVSQPVDLQRALAEVRGGRVAVVGWLPNELNGVPVGPPTAPEAPARFTVVDSAVFEGTFDVYVFVFEDGGVPR